MTPSRVHVRLQFTTGSEISVGTIARSSQRIVFQYDETFLDRPLPLSPFRLPAQHAAHIADGAGRMETFGVFDDAMPDGWGRRVLEGAFRQRVGRAPDTIERLLLVGTRGMGALTFHPSIEEADEIGTRINIGDLAHKAWDLDDEHVDEVLPELRRMAGTSGGARPKALIALAVDAAGAVRHACAGDGDIPPTHEHWIVKFNARGDGRHAGVLEYIWARIAEQAGADVPPHRLLDTRAGRFFATRRFDRPSHDTRLHMHSAAGLLHADFRIPGDEYQVLFDLSDALTHAYAESIELFRRACLNVLACNRDDHLKNTAWLMDATGAWRLSPLFDFTYSEGPNGWHTLSVAGEGRDPRRADLERLGRACGLRHRNITTVLEQTAEAVSGFDRLAREHEIPQRLRQAIGERLRSLARM
jgi:serine/threonine-protein kinase HipA